MNARDFAAAGKDYADNVRFHAPGLGLDLEGRESMMQKIGEFIEGADAHYEVEDVVQHGPFVVAFARATGTLEGQRMAWDVCEVLRFEGDQVAEAGGSRWAARGHLGLSGRCHSLRSNRHRRGLDASLSMTAESD